MTSYLAFTIGNVLSLAAVQVALLAAALFAGKSWGAAVRDRCALRRLARKDARIAELRAEVDRERETAETAGDRARSVEGQALAAATMIREGLDRLTEQVEREINKILAAGR